MNQDKTPRDPLRAALRAAWVARDKEAPLTAKEVAAFDARASGGAPAVNPPPVSPALQFSWEQAAPSGSVLPFPAGQPDLLSLAARARSRVTPETQAKLAALVREMREPPRP